MTRSLKPSGSWGTATLAKCQLPKSTMEPGEEHQMLMGDANAHPDADAAQLSDYVAGTLCPNCLRSCPMVDVKFLTWNCCQYSICEDCAEEFRTSYSFFDINNNLVETYSYVCPRKLNAHKSPPLPPPVHNVGMSNLLTTANGAVASLQGSIQTLATRVTDQGVPPHTASHILSHRLALHSSLLCR